MHNKRKLIVMGANGFVAGSVLAQAGDEWEVHAVSRGNPLIRRDQLSWHTCDPLGPAQLNGLFEQVNNEPKPTSLGTAR